MTTTTDFYVFACGSVTGAFVITLIYLAAGVLH